MVLPFTGVAVLATVEDLAHLFGQDSKWTRAESCFDFPALKKTLPQFLDPHLASKPRSLKQKYRILEHGPGTFFIIPIAPLVSKADR